MNLHEISLGSVKIRPEFVFEMDEFVKADLKLLHSISDGLFSNRHFQLLISNLAAKHRSYQVQKLSNLNL